MSITEFYGALAPWYHLIYEDWESSIERQGSALDSVIRSILDERHRSVLEVMQLPAQIFLPRQLIARAPRQPGVIFRFRSPSQTCGEHMLTTRASSTSFCVPTILCLISCPTRKFLPLSDNSFCAPSLEDSSFFRCATTPPLSAAVRRSSPTAFAMMEQYGMCCSKFGTGATLSMT